MVTSLSLILGVLAAGARVATAQDTSVEEMEKVDPYTKGDKQAMQRLGIVSYGPFHWADTHTSESVREALGGVDMIFLETANFRLGSTLETYKVVEDALEKQFIDDELAALKKSGFKFKATSKIDPWLRAHLYARRLEALHADFCDRFGITAADFGDLEASRQRGLDMGVGPYLGQKEKFTVLLTETRSALGRYLRAHLKIENEHSYRAPFSDCWFLGANFEAIKDGGRPLDVALYAAVASALAQNLLDAFRASNAVAPEWLRYGLAHVYARKVDPRWNQWKAGGEGDPDDKRIWDWQPRVRGLVENEACSTWEQMLAWAKYDDISPREHMIAWSRVDWLSSRPVDERRAALLALTNPVTGFGEERAKLARPQQLIDLTKALGQDPAALDKSWRKWVMSNYDK